MATSRPKGELVRLTTEYCITCALLLAGTSFAGPARYAIIPAEATGKVSSAEAEVFYQAITVVLAGSEDVRIVERRQLKAVLDEQDLGLALSGQVAETTGSEAKRNLETEFLVVPGICKIGQEYFLSLRRLSVAGGRTDFCSVTKTRLTSKFAQCAEAMTKQMLRSGDIAMPATMPKGVSTVSTVSLRNACRNANAEKFFPSLWARSEKLFGNGASIASRDGARNYYSNLLHLVAKAASPPEGMVFIPGGYVSFETREGKKRLWVSAFFIDRFEVSVRQYQQFLDGERIQATDQTQLNKFASITRMDGRFNQGHLPVTGVTYVAGEAYAARSAKRLPTVLEWLRAAVGPGPDDLYPCGDRPSAKRSNLFGTQDGFEVLAPASKPGQDVSAFGVEGLSGNTREWTRTWFHSQLYAKTPPDAPRDPSGGTMKIVKGGSWRTSIESALRNHADKHRPNEAFDDVGFRCIIRFFDSHR